jgi:hypothetical protein
LPIAASTCSSCRPRRRAWRRSRRSVCSKDTRGRSYPRRSTASGSRSRTHGRTCRTAPM